MPRLEGDLLARDGARLVDAINKESEANNTSLYKRYIPAINWHWGSGQADYIPVGTVGYVNSMGKPSSLITSIRIDESWVTGVVYVTLYYSGSANSGNYDIKLSGLAVGEDGQIDGTPGTASSTLSPPSAASSLSNASIGTFSVDANDDVFFLKLERQDTGSDTNAGTFYFVGAM